MRCAVCRCLRGALRSASSTASTNSTAAFSFQRGRSVFFRGFGNALPIASRTIRRCTPNFCATPAIVPTPNSYSRRICSNNSTLALQSNESPLLRASPDSEYPFAKEVGQNKPPNWAALEYRNHAHLFRRIAWRLQALAEGDLTTRARERALALAADADLRLRALRQFWRELEAKAK